MIIEPPKTLTVALAARLFGPTEAQLRAWIARGILPTSRAHGRRVVIQTADLEHVLARR